MRDPGEFSSTIGYCCVGRNGDSTSGQLERISGPEGLHTVGQRVASSTSPGQLSVSATCESTERTAMPTWVAPPLSTRLLKIVARPPWVMFTPYEVFTTGEPTIVRFESMTFSAPVTLTPAVVVAATRSTAKPSSTVWFEIFGGNTTPLPVC